MLIATRDFSLAPKIIKAYSSHKDSNEDRELELFSIQIDIRKGASASVLSDGALMILANSTPGEIKVRIEGQYSERINMIVESLDVDGSVIFLEGLSREDYNIFNADEVLILPGKTIRDAGLVDTVKALSEDKLEVRFFSRPNK